MNSKIKGVNFYRILSNNDKRGFFREIIRLEKNKFLNHDIKQISHSKVKKNIFKGWHGHIDQTQLNYLISGKLLVFLYDDRSSSSSYNVFEYYKINSNTPLVYSFEPGILHGYFTYDCEIEILYLTTEVYNPSKEVRKEFNYNNLDKLISQNGFKVNLK